MGTRKKVGIDGSCFFERTAAKRKSEKVTHWHTFLIDNIQVCDPHGGTVGPGSELIVKRVRIG